MIRITLFCATLLACLVPSQSAFAALITVPSGLNPGDQYRLAFVTTTTRDATSTNIADYNAFVTTDANTVAQLVALGTTWAAIASTATVDARDNTLTHPVVNPDHPIYNLAGNLIASTNAGLWSPSGSGLLTALNINEAGNLHNTVVWTGSTFTGIGDAGAQLGTALAREGTDTNANSAWITFFAVDSTLSQSVYAMSGVLTVAPEPGSMVLAGLAAFGLAVSSRRRRRGDRR